MLASSLTGNGGAIWCDTERRLTSPLSFPTTRPSVSGLFETSSVKPAFPARNFSNFSDGIDQGEHLKLLELVRRTERRAHHAGNAQIPSGHSLMNGGHGLASSCSLDRGVRHVIHLRNGSSVLGALGACSSRDCRYWMHPRKNCGQSGTTGSGSDGSGRSDHSAGWCQHSSWPVLSRCARMPCRSFLTSPISCSRDI
jgi:hypothetical protein